MRSAATIFDQIEDAALRTGNGLGWRLLYSPPAVLRGAPVAIIAHHPVGTADRSDLPSLAMPAGQSAWRDERWDDGTAVQRGRRRGGGAGRATGGRPAEPPQGSAADQTARPDVLQRQVLALCEWLGVQPQDTLSGNLVPFRAADWGAMRRKRVVRRLGRDLWAEILDHVRPPLVVTLGRPVFDEVAELLDAGDVRTIPTGWGDKKGRLATHAWGRLVGLPDLSRAPLFSRPASRTALDDLLGPPA